MSEVKINAALVQANIDAAFGLPCAYEEVPYTPVPGTPWQRFQVLPGDVNESSIGVGGFDEHLGFAQLDFNYPPDKGTALLLEKVDQARAFFVAGKRFFYEGQCVLVLRAERTRIRPVDGWSRVTVSVFYSAQTTRPEV